MDAGEFQSVTDIHLFLTKVWNAVMVHFTAMNCFPTDLSTFYNLSFATIQRQCCSAYVTAKEDHVI